MRGREGLRCVGQTDAMFVPPPNEDPRRAARSLYWQGWTVVAISAALGKPQSTVSAWKTRDKWDDAPVIERIETTIEARLVQLIAKEDKTGGNFKEIDLLGRQIERMARVHKYSEPDGRESDLRPELIEYGRRGAIVQNKKKGKRNSYTEEQASLLRDVFTESLFGYQRRWHDAGLVHRIRDILKSRQIGATWYFAREALMDAIDTGRNQIFLSASKAQAHVFKQYILQFGAEADVELGGDPIVLPNNASLYFLGTNSRTAQSYHGNLYFDEYFWVYVFQTLRKVASGMAMHKKWRQTYFSTPSSLLHDAYPFWTGSLYNRGRAKADRIEVDTSHAALKDGLLCADGQWRQIVTVEDAVAGGCDLFDLQQLRIEYSAAEYAQLLMCEFIDDAASIFPLATMQRCLVDSWEAWDDFKPFAMRPYGSRGVWLGYDPNGDGNGDAAALVVVAPPAKIGGKFRILHKQQFRGMDFAAQAEEIRKMTGIYNITHMGIDVTGIGAGVYQLVRQFFPAAQAITYSPEVKALMVMKALDVISHDRLEFDAGWRDVVQSFMSIRRTLTASGRKVTYVAGRSEETSHADLAWATMHTLINEPLEGATSTNRSILEIT